MMILPAGVSLPKNPRIGYDNLVTSSNVTASEEDTDFPVTNLGNGSTYPPWKGTGTSGQTLVIELGSATTADYLGLARHNFGSAGITYTLSHSSDPGGPFTTIDVESPADDSPIFHQFDPVTDSVFRLTLSSGSVIPELAVMYLGEILVLQRRIYVGHEPITLSPRRRVSTGRSESGQFLGRIRRSETLHTRVSMQNIDPAWYRSNLDPFVQVSDITPFFWAWRPSTYPAEVAYAWADGDPQPANQRPNGMMSWDISIQGIR